MAAFVHKGTSIDKLCPKQCFIGFRGKIEPQRLHGWWWKKAHLQDVDVVETAWIDELRSENLRVTHNGIQGKATELVKSEDDTEFTASRIWFAKVFLSISSEKDFCKPEMATGPHIPKVK